MSYKETLNRIRREHSAPETIQQKILQVLRFFALGMLLGFIAKYSDSIPSNGLIGEFWGMISDITTRLGIWVLLATMIAVKSINPRIGALKVFSFFVGLLLIYYIYSMWLFGFFPTYYFIRWGVIALVSPIAAYVVWFARGNGWIAAFCAGMPIGLLVEEGYPFFYMFRITFALELLFAIFLFLILPVNKKQSVQILTCTILIALILNYSNALTYIFGGL